MTVSSLAYPSRMKILKDLIWASISLSRTRVAHFMLRCEQEAHGVFHGFVEGHTPFLSLQFHAGEQIGVNSGQIDFPFGHRRRKPNIRGVTRAGYSTFVLMCWRRTTANSRPTAFGNTEITYVSLARPPSRIRCGPSSESDCRSGRAVFGSSYVVAT